MVLWSMARPGRIKSHLVRLFMTGAIFALSAVQLPYAADFSSWLHYRDVTITPTGLGASVSSFPLCIRLTTADSAIMQQSQADGFDVVFAGSDGTALSFQRATWDVTGKTAEFWVLVPTIAASGSTTIRMYWGKLGTPATDASNSKAVFSTAAGFQGVWHLNAAAGENEIDATQNAFVAQPATGAAPTSIAGICGGAKAFDGTSQYFTVLNSKTGALAFPPGGPFTISLWVNVTAPGSNRAHLITKSAAVGGDYIGTWGLGFTGYSDGMPLRLYDILGVNTRPCVQDTPAIGSWVHLVCIRKDSTEAGFAMYANGVANGQNYNDANSNASQGRVDTNNVFIGRDAADNATCFNGSMDEIEISNVIRDSDWVKLSYESQMPGQTIVVAGDPQTQPPPAVPELVAPLDNAVDQPVAPILSWGTAANALSYELQVSADVAFAGTVFDQSGIAGLSETVPGLANSTTYYWRVAASNATGSSAWSSGRSFTTIVANAGVPALAAPANGTSLTALSATLSWGSAANATSYGVRVSNDINFGSTIFAQAGLTDLSATVGGLGGGTTYYWQVNAVNHAGETPWSGAWSFAVIGPPAAPTLLLPANNAKDQSKRLDLTWNGVDQANGYQVQVSKSSDFSSIIFDQANLTATTVTVAGLSDETTYFWRVNASNVSGTGPWSEAWEFETSAKKNCGCGSGTAIALLPPVWFKAMASRRRRQKRVQR